MVEPYESRRQKKPTGAVKPMPGKNPGPMRPNAAVTPYLGGNTFPLAMPSFRELGSYYGQAANAARSAQPQSPSGMQGYNPITQQFQKPGNAATSVGNLVDKLPNLYAPSGGAAGYNPIPQQFQTPNPAVGRLLDKLPNLYAPSGGATGYSPIPQQFQNNPASAAQQPTATQPLSSQYSVAPTQPVPPLAPTAPASSGDGGWDTAPGWLARAGGVNTSTPDGRMFAAMNQPSVPMASAVPQANSIPWQAGQAAMNLGSPEMVKANAMPSPVDPFSVPLTPENFNEVWGARKAQIASSMPALAPRSPVQMPAMPANPSPLGTYANPDRGGYRFGFPQQAATPAPMPSPVRSGPNISIPGGAEAVARAEAKRRDAATLAQSFDRLRERSKAAPFGTYLAGTPETIGNLTEDRDWIDPAKTVTEQMTWPEYVMKNRAQMAAMQQGRPFDLTPAWIGPSGRQRPPSTWELAKAKQKSSTTGEGTVAEAIRSRAAERKLKEEPRRAMVTAKAQGRRISPVQAGVEAALTAGRGLTEDQLRAAYGPTYDQIQAQREDSSNKLLAGIAAAIGGAMQPGPNGEPAASPLTISSIFGPLLNRAMGQEGGAPTMPWPGAAPDNSPHGMAVAPFAHDPTATAAFDTLVSDGDYDGAFKFAIGRGSNTEQVKAYLELMGLKPTRSLPKAVADTVNELNSPANIDYGMLMGG